MALDPDTVTRKNFETAFRGYDPMEVQAYLVQVADELRAAEERELDLELRLSDAERRTREALQRMRDTPPPAPPPPAPPSLEDIEPAELVRLVGEETVQVLQSARAAAEQVRVRAGVEADDLLASARAEAEVTHTQALASADVLRSRAEGEAAELVAAARAEASELVTTAEAEAGALVAAAQAEASELVTTAEAEATQMVAVAEAEAADQIREASDEASQLVADAQQLRRQVLDDLADRRHRARIQLEQLHAGHEHLSEVLSRAQLAFQDVDALVAGASEGAREAASVARRQVEQAGPLAVEGIEASLDAGDEHDPEVVASLFARIRAGSDVFETVGAGGDEAGTGAVEAGAVDPAPGAGLPR